MPEAECVESAGVKGHKNGGRLHDDHVNSGIAKLSPIRRHSASAPQHSLTLTI